MKLLATRPAVPAQPPAVDVATPRPPKRKLEETDTPLTTDKRPKLDLPRARMPLQGRAARVASPEIAWPTAPATPAFGWTPPTPAASSATASPRRSESPEPGEIVEGADSPRAASPAAVTEGGSTKTKFVALNKHQRHGAAHRTINAMKAAPTPQAVIAQLRDFKASGALDAGGRPTLFVHTSALSALRRLGEPEMAYRLLMEMRSNGIRPDASCYAAAIGAFHAEEDAASRPGLHRHRVAALLDEAQRAGVLQPSRGLSSERDEAGHAFPKIDFHAKKVLTDHHYDHRHARDYGIPEQLARALFDHHVAEGSIREGTRLIVGKSGEGILRRMALKSLRSHDLGYAEQTLASGRPNPGCLIVRGRAALNAWPTGSSPGRR